MKRLYMAVRRSRLMTVAALILLAGTVAGAALLLRTLLIPGQRFLVARFSPKAMVVDAAKSGAARSDRLPGADRMYCRLDFPLTDEDGNKVSLSSFRGKVVALTFYSTWSMECREEIENINGLRDAAQRAGADVLLVSRLEPGKETREQAVAYLRQAGIGMPVLFDEGNAVYGALDLKWIPNTLFFSPEGVLMSGVSGPGMTESRLLAHIGHAAFGGGKATEAFVRSNLATWQGAVAGSYKVTAGQPRADGLLLSESQALFMGYAVMKGDKALFDGTYGAAMALLHRDGLLLDRREDGRNGNESDAGWNLEVVRALMDGDAAFGGYGEDIKAHADALMRHMVGPGNTLRGSYDFGGGVYSNEIALWQADLFVLKQMAELKAAWRPVYENASSLVAGGRISQEVPLYFPSYDYGLKAYAGDVVRMEENMAVLLHLAEAGMLPKDAAAQVKAMLQAGRVAAAYTAQGLVPEGYDYESPAVYGLCVRLGLALGDGEMARLALDKMESLRIYAEDSPLNGSYSKTQSTDIPAFDVLTALSAWQAALNAGLFTEGEDLLP